MNEPYLDAFGRAMTVGSKVLYTPGHAHGDLNHPDCERGVVTSWNASFVFVRYGSRLQSQATTPSDLTVQVENRPVLTAVGKEGGQ